MYAKERIYAVFIIICMLVSFTAYGADEPTDSIPNLISNSGFEEGIWASNKMGVLDTEVYYNGKQSGKVQSFGTRESYIATDYISVNPSKSYNLSVYIKTDKISLPQGAYVRIQQYNAINATLGMGKVKWVATGGTHDWTRFETTVNELNEKTARIKIFLAVGEGNSGTAWFDDLSFYSGDEEKISDEFGFEGTEWTVKKNASVDSKEKRSGNCSAKFIGTGEDEECYYGSSIIEVNPARTYDLSVWIKTEDVSAVDGACVQVQQLDASKSNIGMGPKRISTGGTQDWTKYNFVLNTLNPNTAYVRIYVKLAAKSKGTAWFDDITFKPRAFEINTSALSPTGNIFSPKNNMELKLDIYNPVDSEQNIKLSYKIRDYENAVIEENEKDIIVNFDQTSTVAFNISSAEKAGTYSLEIDAQNEAGEKVYRKVLFTKVNRENNNIRSDKFGVQTRFSKHQNDAYDYCIPLVTQIGAGWIRDEVLWHYVEKEKGVYQMPEYYEEYINEATKNGLNVLVILVGANTIYGTMPPVTDEAIEAYAKYCGYVASYYKGRVNHFEIWNEYNIKPQNSSPEIYAKTIKRAYEEIKKANPDAAVVGGSTARVDTTWLKRVFEAGGHPYMDAVSVHPYSYPTPPDAPLLSSIENVHNVIKEYGEDKPVWATEYGYPTHTGNSTERESAWKLARAFVLARTSDAIDKLIWYVLDNPGVNIDEQEHNFGLLRNLTLKGVEYTAKESYVSYNVASSMMNDVEFIKEISNDNIRIFKFKKNDSKKDLVVVWAKENHESVDLSVDSKSITYTDVLGNSTELFSNNGKINITAFEEPIYLEGDFSEISIDTTSFSMDKYENEVATSGSFGTSVTSILPYEELKEYKINPKLPHGWAVIENKGFTEDGTASVYIKTPNDTVVGDYTLEMNIIKNDKVVSVLKSKVEVLPIIQSEAVPTLDKKGVWDNWSVSIRLKNISETLTLSGKVALLSPLDMIDGDQEYQIDNLGPQKEMVINIPISKIPENDNILFSYRIDVENSEHSYSFEYGRNIGFLAAVKATPTPEINGKIDIGEWQDSMQFNFTRYRKLAGEDKKDDKDINAHGWAKWDDENLYVAVQVEDEEHNQNQLISEMWKGDSVQIGLDTKRLDLKRKENLEIDFSLTNEGKSQSWCSTTIGGAPLGEIAGVKNVISRDESAKITTYELAIPWEQIIMVGEKPTTDDVIGFSILVNDNDDNIRQGYVEYMSGVGAAKSTTKYGDLLFIE